MNTDFRLSVGIFNHPKVKRVKRRLGADGVLSYMTLLAFAAMYRPGGDLRGMDAEAIADAGDYDGDAAGFVTALTEAGLLDQGDDGTLSIHDWAEHNPWASEAQKRSEHARTAASKRWEKAGNAQNEREDKPDHARAMPEQQTGNAPLLSSPILSSPLPAEEKDANANALSAAPPPVAKEKSRTSVKGERAEALGQEAVAAYQDRFKARYGHYAELIQGDAPALKDTRIKLTEARFFPALDAFFACQNERVTKRRHAVRMFTGEINVWLDPEAVAEAFPPPGLSRASPPARLPPGQSALVAASAEREARFRTLRENAGR